MKKSLFTRVSGLFNLASRSFSAAGNDEFIATWLKDPETVYTLVKNNLQTLRARSRDQVNNNDYARRFISMVKSHVVGPDGFTFQARCIDNNGKLDKLANDAIEGAFADWSKKKNCDITGQLTFKEMQRLAVATAATDGELFVLKLKPKNEKYSFQLQLIDAEWVPLKLIDTDKNIHFGIEYSQQGKPIAVHVASNKGNKLAYNYHGEYYERIEAMDIYHIFIPERINQKRGLPWLSTALLRLKMLNGFEDAALVNARVGASKMGFFTSPDGSSYMGDGVASDGSIISEVSPGLMEQLPAGMDIKTFDPTYPSNEYASFTQRALKGIASGLGVSYHKLGNDLENVNYSSGRLGELEDREMWKSLQDWFIDAFLMPIYEDWLEVQLNKGTITVNNNPLKKDRIEKYKRVVFQGRRWQWVDPVKEVNAQEKQISLGLRSRSDIIREQGRDPDDVWLEIQREQEIMKGLNIYNEPVQRSDEIGGDNEE